MNIERALKVLASTRKGARVIWRAMRKAAGPVGSTHTIRINRPRYGSGGFTLGSPKDVTVEIRRMPLVPRQLRDRTRPVVRRAVARAPRRRSARRPAARAADSPAPAPAADDAARGASRRLP